MVELRHRWDDDAAAGERRPAPVQHATCRTCGVRRRTRYLQGARPFVEYLWSGLGWVAKRPDCIADQRSLLPAPAPPPDPAPTSALVHECHAFGCATPVHPRFLMCRDHWFQLPQELRRAVNAAFVPGQEEKRVRPTQAWLNAAQAAVTYIAEQEGRLDYPRALRVWD